MITTVRRSESNAPCVYVTQSSYIAAEICSVRKRSIRFLILDDCGADNRQPKQFAQASCETDEAVTVYFSTVTAICEPMKSCCCNRRTINVLSVYVSVISGRPVSRQISLTFACVINHAERYAYIPIISFVLFCLM